MDLPQLNTKPLLVEDINSNPSVQRIYANGVGFANSFTEGTIILLIGQNPVATVLMPFPVIKTLRDGLNKVISDIEKASGASIKDINEINIEWQKNKSETKTEIGNKL